MDEKALTGKKMRQSSVCTLAGMAIGFRTFYAVVIDGGHLYGSGWLAILLAMIVSLPVSLLILFLNRKKPQLHPAEIIRESTGNIGCALIGLILACVLVYDAGAVLRIITGMVKYVALQETGNVPIAAVTAVSATAALLMGPDAIADSSVLWKRLAVVLVGVLIVSQIPYFRAAWLTPVLGQGMDELIDSALPAAGMLSFIAGGWLMTDTGKEKKETALLRTGVYAGLSSCVLAALCGMLVPGLTDEPVGRSFRLGRLLANARAGLSLELPYVVLLYSGMVTVLLFELAAAAKAITIAIPAIKGNVGALSAGAGAFMVSVSGVAEREMASMLSKWYFPAVGVSLLLVGLCAVARGRTGGKEKEV